MLSLLGANTVHHDVQWLTKLDMDKFVEKAFPAYNGFCLAMNFHGKNVLLEGA
jgi:hypothetical protein